MKTEEQCWENFKKKRFPLPFMKNEELVCIVDANLDIVAKTNVIYDDKGDLSPEVNSLFESYGFSIDDLDFYEEFDEIEFHAFVDFKIDVELGDIKCSGKGSDEYVKFADDMDEKIRNQSI